MCLGVGVSITPWSRDWGAWPVFSDNCLGLSRIGDKVCGCWIGGSPGLRYECGNEKRRRFFWSWSLLWRIKDWSWRRAHTWLLLQMLWPLWLRFWWHVLTCKNEKTLYKLYWHWHYFHLVNFKVVSVHWLKCNCDHYQYLAVRWEHKVGGNLRLRIVWCHVLLWNFF